MSTLLGFGITLEQVKNYLGYVASDTTSDFRLIMTFNAAVAALSSATGRNLVYGSYRDTFNPMFNKVYLRETPVAFLHQIVGATTVVASNNYRLSKKTGLVEFTNVWPFQHRMDGFWGATTVDYVGGYQVLPPDLQLALFTALQAADVYQKQAAATGAVVKRLTVYDVGVTEYATGSSTSSVLTDTLASMLGASLVDGGYSIGTPSTHESELMGPAGFWDPTEGSPPSSPPIASPAIQSPDTRPRFVAAGPSAFQTPQALLDSMSPFWNAFSLRTTAGMYGWVAVRASAQSVRFYDGTAYGLWSGAGLPSNNPNPGLSDPSQSNVTFTDRNGLAWRFFRQDYANMNPSPVEYTLAVS